MESDGDKEKFFNRAGQIAADKMSQTIDAATKLAGAEKGATKSHGGSGTSGRDDSTRATKDREKEPGSSFKNNVGKDKDDKKGGFFRGKGKDTSKFSGKLNSPRNLKAAWKKGGPVGLLIALLLLGGGGLMLGSQTAMPFAIANRLTEEFNTMGVSNNGRYAPLFSKLIAKNKVSPKQIEALKKQGFEVDDSQKGKLLLSWDEEIDGKTVKKNAELDGDTKSLRNLINSNEVFKNKFYAASQKWRGQNSGWYDSMTTKIFKVLGLSNIRSHYSDYEDTGDIEANKKSIQEKTATKKKVQDGDMSYNERNKDGDLEEQTDSQDNKIKTGDDVDTVGKKMRARAEKAAGAATGASQVVCGVMQAAGTISALVAAQQMIEMMNVAGAYLESVQKVQAGEGSQSPMHYLNQQMTESSIDNQGNRINSAMESTGMSSLFNNTSGPGPQDKSTLSANIESLTNMVQIGGISLVFSAEAFRNCTYARAVSGVGDIVLDALAIPSFGITEGVKIFIKIIGSVGVQALVAQALDIMIPWAAGLFIRNLATDVVGEDLGNAVASGATEMMSKNHQGSGGGPGTKAKVIAFRQQQQIALAEQADFDRATLSPFDTSSRYTFLGSLAFTIFPRLATISSAWPALFTQTNAMVLTSIANLSPTTAAIATTDLNQYEGSCPYLESVGGVGDAFCNPYYTTDTDTLDYDEDWLIQTIASLDDNFEGSIDTLNPKVKENSNLAKFQKFCGNRESLYGIADASIASHFDGTGVDQVDAGIGAIPIIGGLADVTNAIQETANQGWISGQNCIATDEAGSFWQTEGKYYQRFSEDQRLLTDTEAIGENTEEGASHLLAIGDKYRETMMADQSHEAQLARLSGLTKDQVVDTLALLEEYEFIANYDPSDLGPVLDDQQDEAYDFSSDSVIANINHDNPIQNSTNLAQHYVIYADLRTRTQVA